MRLQVVATPDPAHAGLADPLCHRHGAATPMRASFGLRLQSGVNHGLDSSHIVTGFPAPAGSNLPKRLGPAAGAALAPEANRLTVHAVLSGDHHLRLASRNSQDNAATERYLLWSSQGYHPALEFAALVRRQDER